MSNDLTADELLTAISKQWASTKDIMKIGGIGENNALKIKNQIADEIRKSGKNCFTYKVPMPKVIEYFEIDIDFLLKVSHKGKRK